MKAVREVATFRSRRFLPILPEASQLRPGVYGAELAFWLAGKLAQQGVVTRYPVAGDGCWLLEYEVEEGAAFQLRCVNAAGSDAGWRIALASDSPASFGQARSLVNALRFVLHAGVPRADIDWRYDMDSQA